MNVLGIITISMLLAIFQLDISNGQLNPSQVEEGKCINVDDQLSENTLFPEEITWFVPLASQYTFRQYAEVFLGRPVRDAQELAQMCLTISLKGGIVVTSGYNKSIEQDCDFTPKADLKLNKVQVNCVIVKSSPGTKVSLIDDYQASFVLTDSKTNIMLNVFCVNGVKSYKVFSTSTEIPDHNLLTKIKQKIVALGFLDDLMLTLPCADQN